MGNEWELPANVEKSTIERVRGGGFSWESGVHDAAIKMVYLNQAESEAISFNVVLENAEGKELKEAFWIKSGKAKGNKTYYTKDKKDYPLPGYSVANSLCVAVTGESLAKSMATAEKKTINIYDFKAGKEVPVERPVLMGLTGKHIKVAVHNVLEDKRKKNNTNGQYEPTGETRTVNECKFFGNVDGKTAEEILEGQPATMFDAWAAKNTGTVIDKSTKKVAGVSAAAIMNGAGGTASTPAQPAASLFQK